MEKLRDILEERYHIITDKILAAQGGWASLVFIIQDINEDFYFLKVYEKNRKSTSYLTEHIGIYLPIVDWLNNNTPLNGKIIRLVKTLDRDYACEDESNLYILCDYIRGHTVGNQTLTDEQVIALAGIVSQLHHINPDIPFDVNRISESFHQHFIYSLSELIGELFNLLKEDIKEILKPCLAVIRDQIEEVNYLAASLKEQNLKCCLCHTDIHHWNMMVNDKQLYLLDWEGIKFALPEADIFSLSQQPYFDLFIKIYKEYHPGYQINELAIKYYSVSRKLHDIFEFTEQLQFDQLTKEAYKINLNYLRKECHLLRDVSK